MTTKEISDLIAERDALRKEIISTQAVLRSALQQIVDAYMLLDTFRGQLAGTYREIEQLEKYLSGDKKGGLAYFEAQSGGIHEVV